MGHGGHVAGVTSSVASKPPIAGEVGDVKVSSSTSEEALDDQGNVIGEVPVQNLPPGHISAEEGEELLRRLRETADGRDDLEGFLGDIDEHRPEVAQAVQNLENQRTVGPLASRSFRELYDLEMVLEGNQEYRRQQAGADYIANNDQWEWMRTFNPVLSQQLEKGKKEVTCYVVVRGKMEKYVPKVEMGQPLIIEPDDIRAAKSHVSKENSMKRDGEPEFYLAKVKMNIQNIIVNPDGSAGEGTPFRYSSRGFRGEMGSLERLYRERRQYDEPRPIENIPKSAQRLADMARSTDRDEFMMKFYEYAEPSRPIMDAKTGEVVFIEHPAALTGCRIMSVNKGSSKTLPFVMVEFPDGTSKKFKSNEMKDVMISRGDLSGFATAINKPGNEFFLGWTENDVVDFWAAAKASP